MTPRETANDLARTIGQAVENEVMRRRQREHRFFEPRSCAYASGIKPCARQMALSMQMEEPAVNAESAARMARGRESETFIYRLLEDAGQYSNPRFEVVQGQLPIKIKGREGELLISGRLDFRLKFDGMKNMPPVEHKGGMAAQRCFRYEDFARSPWTWSYPRQLLCYLYETNEPFGFMSIDTGGLPRLIPVVLEDHLDDAEEALRLSEEAVAAVKAGELPEFHRDRAVCKSCPFFMGACAPPIDYGEGFGIITDERVIENLEIRARTSAAADQYDAADKEVKALLKGAGHEGSAIAGRFMIEQTWQRSNTLEIPAPLEKALDAALPELNDRALVDAQLVRTATRPEVNRFEKADADLKARLRSLPAKDTGLPEPLESVALAYRAAAMRGKYMVKIKEVIPAEEPAPETGMERLVRGLRGDAPYRDPVFSKIPVEEGA